MMEILVQSLMFKEMVNESSQWQLVVKDFKQQNKFFKVKSPFFNILLRLLFISTSGWFVS